MGATSGAYAAEADSSAGAQLEEVIVTGTSIRGAAPVGSNLITVSREDIEKSGAQTVQQLLRSVPAVTGFGSAGTTGGGGGLPSSFDGANAFAPTIHGLGASASNATLVLIDGHRLPLSGLNHTLADPSVVAPLAIERVEVLPDGASSVYGSDALAGVINFITRKNYNGFQAAAQGAFADGYSTQNASFLWGTSGEQGSVLVSYGYSKRSSLSAGDRPYTVLNKSVFTGTKADGTTAAGSNQNSNNCGQASVVVAGLRYVAPYSGAAVSNAGCDYSGVPDLLPEDIRHNFLVRLDRNVGDKINLTADLVFSKEVNTAQISRGTAGVNAVTNANPYFKGPTGATSENVSWDANDLLGPGATNTGGADSMFATLGAEFKLQKDWRMNIGTTIGQDNSRSRRDGAICSNCVAAALTGATVGTAPFVGWLDVWNPASGNQTSPAVLASITDSIQLQIAHQTMLDATLKFDGPLFALPGGSARAAVGAEHIRYAMDSERTSAGVNPASTNSSTIFLSYNRDVTAGYAELLLPFVGSQNARPGLRSLELNLSGRYDKYSDFGNTTNPRFAVTWGVTDLFKVRANAGKSFVAPALTSRGNDQGVTAESGYSGIGINNSYGVAGQNFVIPAGYPGAATMPGCTANAPCVINNAALPGIQITGGNKDLQPQTGETYSFGFDLGRTSAGFRASATYWSAKYRGGITAPQPLAVVTSPDLQGAMVLYPNGMTPAEIAGWTAGLPQTGPLPTTAYFVSSYQQRNAFNMNATGIDAELGQRLETGVGTFDLGLSISRKLKMDEQFGNNGPWFSVLNTIGFNTTFPSNRTNGRFDVTWKRANLSADVFYNYTEGYIVWNANSPFNVLRDNRFVPIGGGQKMGAVTTVDAHVAYDFKAGMLEGAQVFLDANNLFDRQPDFVNNTNGYDNWNNNPIGRLLTIGINKKW